MFLLYCIFFLRVYIDSSVHCAEVELEPPLWSNSTGRDTRFLTTVLREHYREIESEVHIRIWNGNDSQSTPFQDDLVEDITRFNTDWMIVSFGDLAALEHRLGYYHVFLVLDYDSFCAGLLDLIDGGSHHFYGLYTFYVEQLADPDLLADMMHKLWRIPIINAIVIVEESDGEYVAYSYYPYQERSCGVTEPHEIGRYVNGTWDKVGGLFPNKLANLHGCPLAVATVEIKPFSMMRVENNRTMHFGYEVYIVETLAARLNFTIRYVEPTDNSKWGILSAYGNSTGLVGMLQRKEVDFGFGSLGFSLSRHTYLKMGIPNMMTQMIMGIPPKRPYTSLEKLFQPFTVDAWLCIAFGYAMFGLVTIGLIKLNRGTHRDEEIRNPLYLLWVLLMGGSGTRFRLDSTRLFMVGFILNTLIMRTLYQAGMFQKLQSSAPLASDLNTLDAINKAGVYYNMFRASLQFYKDNPKVPARLVQNDHTDWDELFYLVAHDRLGGVMVSPLECIAYYVKRYGIDGVVYLGKNTGFMYNLGFHFPKTTALQGPFDEWILRMHTSGLTHIWAEKFRDNRYWANAKDDPEPASLKWNQISGGFYLCGALIFFASVVFLGELIHFRLRASRLFRCAPELRYEPEKEAGGS